MGNLVVIGGGGGKGDDKQTTEHDWTEYTSSAKGYDHWKKDFKNEYEMYKTSEGVKWGIKGLDNTIKLYGKRLVFILARSKFGKSSFVANMVRANIKSNKKVLIFSCEEAGSYFTSRLINANFYHPLDKQKMRDNYFLRDDSVISVDEIINECRVNKPDIVFIDQMNKMRLPTSSYTDKHSRTVAVAECLQGVVKKIGVPLVVLHQLNREAASHKGLFNQSHVSDCDAVYNEANICLFLQSTAYQEWENGGKISEPDKRIFEYQVNVSKNRSFGGFEGVVGAFFDRSTSYWFDKAPHILEEYEQKKKEWNDKKKEAVS